jgi:hypothetical protein
MRERWQKSGKFEIGTGISLPPVVSLLVVLKNGNAVETANPGGLCAMIRISPIELSTSRSFV